MHAPVVVLGGGPGGYAAAFLAADEGLEVILVEAESRLGGTCLLRGCIPSKALLHVAKVISEVHELTDEWGVEYNAPKIDIDKVRARKDKVIETLTGGLGQLSKRRNVKVIKASLRTPPRCYWRVMILRFLKAGRLRSTIVLWPQVASLQCPLLSTSVPRESWTRQALFCCKIFHKSYW
jgi:choline dehydrogenase-like flavoprotein